MSHDRRSFLKTAAGASALALLPPNLRAALAEPLQHRTGTIADVEHVVIFMQENRSFDHYFGTLQRRARVFRSARRSRCRRQAGLVPAEGRRRTSRRSISTAARPARNAWRAWITAGRAPTTRWKNHDAWIPTKTPMTMGYFTRADIPFYLRARRRLHDLRRLSLLDLRADQSQPHASCSAAPAAWPPAMTASIASPIRSDEDNETADIDNDSKAFKPFTWATYAERAGNGGRRLARLSGIRQLRRQRPGLFRELPRAGARTPISSRAAASWVKGSNKANAAASRGEHLVKAFGHDVAAGRLPQVSWIVAPTVMSEHPSAPPGFGESLSVAPARRARGEPQGLVEDRVPAELRRERRLLRPHAARDPATYIGHRRQHGEHGGRGLSRRAVRLRTARADALDLAVERRRLRQLAALRSHLRAALPGDALRRRRARTSPPGAARSRAT